MLATGKRVRPKLMTVGVILAGLIPIMFSDGAGADVMKRIPYSVTSIYESSYLFYPSLR